jgi:hypothetical protein
MRATVLLVFALAAAAGAQSVPVNFSGKWSIQGVGGRGGGGAGGRGGAQILVLNQVGTEVTGEFGTGRGGGGSTAPVNSEILGGKVEGATISFYVWRGNDRPAKTFYKGTMNAAGDQIEFTVTGGPARGGGNAPPAAPPAAPAPIIARRTK